MKKNNIPGNATPAPANKAENSAKHAKRNAQKEAAARNRARRIKSLLRKGLTKEEILKVFKDEEVRTIMCLYYGSFTIEDGTRKKKINKEEVEVPNILYGRHAAEKFLEINDIKTIGAGPTYCWVKTNKDEVEGIAEKLKQLGRVYIYKPEVMTKEKIEERQKKGRKAKEKLNKKPSNNTTEVKKAAKTNRKNTNVKKAEMRPYYAALRKGGVNARIKKHNQTLADKIEKWLKERATIEAEKAERNKEYRAKHRQLTSIEKKANKYARKAAKHLAAQERRKAQELKRMEYNAKIREKRAQKAQKPVQTELKEAA